MADESFTEDDRALLAELGHPLESQKRAEHTLKQKRIITGFEDIQCFIEKLKRIPERGEDKDIFERLHAVRLDRLRDMWADEEYRVLLEPYDSQGLLATMSTRAASERAELEGLDGLDDGALLAKLGIECTAAAAAGAADITDLRHVRSNAEKRAAEDIANREKCEDFEMFNPLFTQVQAELKSGTRKTRVFELKAEIKLGSFFIVGGQKAYVAAMGEVFTNASGHTDARLRVIFDNGTQSNLLMRSLQRALHKDAAGRRITEPSAGPLFSSQTIAKDEASGTIYVLRSKSDHPLVAGRRDVIHKIGVTNMTVEQRIAGARLEPTFLMADVEIVATYELYNINRTKLENLLHRIFALVRLEIEIKNRFGKPVVPREWFIVPLSVIDEVVEKIKNDSIANFYYDPNQCKILPVDRIDREAQHSAMK